MLRELTQNKPDYKDSNMGSILISSRKYTNVSTLTERINKSHRLIVHKKIAASNDFLTIVNNVKSRTPLKKII